MITAIIATQINCTTANIAVSTLIVLRNSNKIIICTQYWLCLHLRLRCPHLTSQWGDDAKGYRDGPSMDDVKQSPLPSPLYPSPIPQCPPSPSPLLGGALKDFKFYSQNCWFSWFLLYMAFGRIWAHGKHSHGTCRWFAYYLPNFQKLPKIEKCQHFPVRVFSRIFKNAMRNIQNVIYKMTVLPDYSNNCSTN